MKPLTGLDAAFLYLESDRAPMHVGGLLVVSGTTPEGPLDFTRYRTMMSERMHLATVFRRRLVELPLNLGHPYWIEDPDFELDNHLLNVILDDPGGWPELLELSAQFFSTRLARSRPLWEVLFVSNCRLEGYPDDCVAVLSKVHHAAIDGVSGAEIQGAILDPTAAPRKLPTPPPWQPERVPSTAELLARTYGKAVTKTVGIAKMLGRTVAGTVSVAGALSGSKLPPMLFSAPKTVLNHPVTSRRSFGMAILPLERIKKLKNRAGATVNDVVLAVCSGALRRYLMSREDLPEKPLVAMAPISTRRPDQKDTLGNQITGMLVSLATDLPEPQARLARIMESARGSKTYSRAAKVTDLLEVIPSETAALASRLYCSTKIADKHNPFFNCIITNVPGPQQPLYLSGAEVLANIGMAPIFDGIGLILVVLSYNGQLSISATSCASIVPDVAGLTDLFGPALTELEEAIPEGWSPPTVRPVAKPKTLADATHNLRHALDRLESLIEQDEGTPSAAEPDRKD